MSTEKTVFYDGPLGRFVVEFFKGRAYLHLKMRAQSLDAMREARTLAPKFFGVLRSIGYRVLYAYNRETEVGWPRFMALFGFREKGRSNGWILMERENA